MYQVLARKYRPRNFNELVGQTHVSRALTNALDRGRLHHAYLFTGTRGVGKTTIARILAKCLNCEMGTTSTPCETCATCRAVNEGRFIDLIEIDAASRTRVEDTRELLDNVPYAPTQGRFKVYLIDEVHMLSTHSFNALLKTLEEPPEHVKFLFATTDPQKLPITVISRCLQFTLRPLAIDEIIEHLTEILQKEAILADQNAIWQIAEAAQGSLRDALSLTDQAIAYGQGAIHHQDVKEMLGLIDRTLIYDLIAAIHKNQHNYVSELLLQFRQQALDVSLVLDQLISTLHELALLQYLPDLSLKYSQEINQKIIALSSSITAQDLQLYYQIACKGRAELPFAVTQEQGFEMCVLRLLAFRPLAFDEVPVQKESNTFLNHQQNEGQHEQTLEESVSADDNQHEIESEDDVVDHSDYSKESSDEDYRNLSQSSDVKEVEEDKNILIFDVKNDQLLGLQESPSVHHVSLDEMAIFPIDESIQPPNDRVANSSINKPTLNVLENNSGDESNLEKVQTESFSMYKDPQHDMALDQVTPENSIQSSHLLSPQELLKIPEPELQGEWTLDKWEYWLRNSALSAAVQELAQYGIMSGEINNISTFCIPPQYEKMLSQFKQVLEAEICRQWPDTQFVVQYSDVHETTPYIKQVERKQKAHQRAIELFHQTLSVKKLLETFDGQLDNIQLNS